MCLSLIGLSGIFGCWWNLWWGWWWCRILRRWYWLRCITLCLILRWYKNWWRAIRCLVCLCCICSWSCYILRWIVFNRSCNITRLSLIYLAAQILCFGWGTIKLRWVTISRIVGLLLSLICFIWFSIITTRCSHIRNRRLCLICCLIRNRCSTICPIRVIIGVVNGLIITRLSYIRRIIWLWLICTRTCLIAYGFI